jgi:hypothetical protein
VGYQKLINYLSDVLIEIIAYNSGYTGQFLKGLIIKNQIHGEQNYMFKFSFDGDHANGRTLVIKDCKNHVVLRDDVSDEFRIYISFKEITATDLYNAIVSMYTRDVVES